MIWRPIKKIETVESQKIAEITVVNGDEELAKFWSKYENSISPNKFVNKLEHNWKATGIYISELRHKKELIIK